MKMLKIAFFLSLCFYFNEISPNSVYLWESWQGGESSCCLAMAGVDICNPQVPCTRSIFIDLTGIDDYVTRILSTDRGSNFSFTKLLKQAKVFIKYAFATSCIGISYRFDEQRPVTFIHDAPDFTKSEKGAKQSVGQVALSPVITSVSNTEKNKAESSAQLAYLKKLGLVHDLK